MARYHDLLADARDVFGLTYREAQTFYREFRDVLGYSPGPEDLRTFGDLAADLVSVEDMPEFDDPDDERAWLEWSLSGDARDFDDWLADEWIGEGEDMEVTEDVHYE